MNRNTVLAAIFLIFSSDALAGACDHEASLSDTAKVQLAQVTQKTDLHWGNWPDEGCQQAGTCGQERYLVAGDQVVVTATQGDWACVWYSHPGGRVTWRRVMPRRNLQVIRPPATPLTGTWQAASNTILLRPAAKKLLVRGTATWPFLNDPSPDAQQQIARGGVNTGSIDAATPWQVGQTNAHFKDAQQCELKVRTLGPYLLATDNGQCGGINVTFEGIYRRTSTAVSDANWKKFKPL